IQHRPPAMFVARDALPGQRAIAPAQFGHTQVGNATILRDQFTLITPTARRLWGAPPRHMFITSQTQIGIEFFCQRLFDGEHSGVAAPQRCPLNNQQESITSSCHTRRPPWELLRLSRSRRSVQENNGTPCASSFTSASINGSIPWRRSGTSRQ